MQKPFNNFTLFLLEIYTKHLKSFLFYLVFLLICFLIFQHGDLFHTSISSYALLNGHFADFYDYNKIIVGRNDYYILMYIIFAIWNIPLKLLGYCISKPILLTPIELIWTKLLLVILFFLTVYIIYKIANLISNNTKKANYISYIFATSPIAIFDVFIFGQYDIIGTFFTMLGIYFYLKRDLFKFALFFSLAISLKFFAIILFIPLLLLATKDILKIIKYLSIGASATIIQVLIYLPSMAFKSNFINLAKGKVLNLESLNLSAFNNSPYLIIVFTLVCLFAYLYESNNKKDRDKTVIFMCLILYSTLFSTVIWHPQWLIILMPFFALSLIYIKNLERIYFLDMIGMIVFILLVVNIFPNNVDVSMLKTGVLRELFPRSIETNNRELLIKFTRLKTTPPSETTPPQTTTPLQTPTPPQTTTPLQTTTPPESTPPPISPTAKLLFHYLQGVFFVYLFTPVLAYLFQRRKSYLATIKPKLLNYFFLGRLYVGLVFFIVSCLICYYWY